MYHSFFKHGSLYVFEHVHNICSDRSEVLLKHFELVSLLIFANDLRAWRMHSSLLDVHSDCSCVGATQSMPVVFWMPQG